MLDRHFIFPPILSAPLLLFTLTAMAATTGTILITGSIPQVCSVTVNAQAIASSLDLAVSQSALLVANVTEACNDKGGYKVALNTMNGNTSGLFRGTGANPDLLPYAVSYSGVAVNFAGGAAQVTNALTRSPSAGIVKPVAITYTGNGGFAAGAYSDLLTFTLTAN